MQKKFILSFVGLLLLGALLGSPETQCHPSRQKQTKAQIEDQKKTRLWLTIIKSYINTHEATSELTKKLDGKNRIAQLC